MKNAFPFSMTSPADEWENHTAVNLSVPCVVALPIG